MKCRRTTSRHRELLKEFAELEGDEIQPRKDGILDRLKDMLSGGE
ncbi:MAG: hypothetical protein U5N86_13160 [Planctomycetota bacterium]|nr:hypothetical protein [Planctomycetota bacterium]